MGSTGAEPLLRKMIESIGAINRDCYEAAQELFVAAASQAHAGTLADLLGAVRLKLSQNFSYREIARVMTRRRDIEAGA